MSIVYRSISPGLLSTASALRYDTPIALTSKGDYPRIRLPGGVHLTRGRHAVSQAHRCTYDSERCKMELADDYDTTRQQIDVPCR